MLIFKKNICSRQQISPNGYSSNFDIEVNELFDPRALLSVALEEETDVISFLKRQPTEYWPQDSKKFYPIAHKIGNYTIFDNLLDILKSGLDDQVTWQQMNTFHFCFLYDVLIRFAFNYNHDNAEGRFAVLSELKGKPFQFELFIKDYFFNTVFLLDEDRYNSLTREEKIKLGYGCPHQFAVINGLTPTKNEMELQPSPDYPYSIYV
jgi:hypothetical protein